MILQKIKQPSRDRQREPDKNICFSSLEPENTPGVNGMHYLLDNIYEFFNNFHTHQMGA